MAKMLPELTSSKAIKRYEGGRPILQKTDIPYDAECIFNAGVTKYHGKYFMLFRKNTIIVCIKDIWEEYNRQ